MEKVRLGDVCTKVTDYVASGSFAALKENVLITNQENYAVMVKTADFANGFTRGLTYTDEHGYNFLRNSNLFGGELILSNIGSIGKVFKVPFLNRPMTLASNTIMLKTETHELTNYLYYYFLSEAGYKNLMSISSGTSMLKFNKTELKKILIPIYEKDERKQIIEILTCLDKIIEKRKQQLEKLDVLVKARFVEMFGDLKANSKNWKVLPFGAFAQIDTKMIHDFNGYEKFPHIGIDSIEKNTGRLIGYRTVEEDGVISGKYLFTPNHIIYSKIRPNLNKVALPEFSGVCSADAYPILAKKEICTREFLAYTMRSDMFLDYILAFSNRTNLPKVNKQQVEGFECPIPNYELQCQFSGFVRKIDLTKKIIENSLEKLETLKKALMQKYFG